MGSAVIRGCRGRVEALLLLLLLLLMLLANHFGTRGGVNAQLATEEAQDGVHVTVEKLPGIRMVHRHHLRKVDDRDALTVVDE